MLPGDTITKLSIDSILDDSNQHLYPTEFLNLLNISGLPRHKLNLKIDQPIICLRNINPNEGLCNGTRLKIKAITNRLIQAKITIGQFKDKTVFIPKMPLIPSDTHLPFDFKRLQFPIRPAFAITINKSQGQTLRFVSIWLGINYINNSI
jgi:ATP-dependent DNA helicase PIF1